MATRIYGASDDLIEFEGDVYGEVGCYGMGDDDDDDPGTLVVCSDGTLLDVKYGDRRDLEDQVGPQGPLLCGSTSATTRTRTRIRTRRSSRTA